MKYWPTEKQIKTQLVAAIIFTAVPVLNGFQMFSDFSPFNVLSEIFFVAGALFMRTQYFNLKVLADIKEILSTQEQAMGE